LTVPIDNPQSPLYLSIDPKYEEAHFVKRNIALLMVLNVGILFSSVGLSQLWAQSNSPVGIFESHGDVGTVLHPGSADFDASKKIYTLTGSGENMWFTSDAFQFMWKKISGDATLTADISFLGTGGNEHRKAALMFRQSLDTGSPYVDIARHGNGMTALQFRSETGALTHEIISEISAPKRLRIVKRGDYVYMSLAGDDGVLHVAGGWLRIPLQGQFYAGIGVCSHDKDVIEKAEFSNVDLTTAPASAGAPTLYSTLERVGISSTDRQVIYNAPGRFEAPNWTRDGQSFLFNRDGHVERIPVTGGKPEVVDTGIATRCNNDHGISPDGTQLAISDNSQEKHDSLVYIVPIGGGAARRITQNSPSYWHAWSPDGKTLAFVGQRAGDFDIYTLPVEGGTTETRLTTAKGLDDGPEYSPDGKYIYFNSERTGHMQIWRMHADGSEQEQFFSDDNNNWFPHISPDGQWMVFITYDKSVTGHPENKDVTLRVMSLSDKKIKVVANLFGGQGTINVPSWSPDSKQVAFVSYQLVPEEK
jgi:TolB protein